MTKAKVFHSGNEEAAHIILSDPERYAGLPLEWARLWVERHGIPRKERTPATESSAAQLKAASAGRAPTIENDGLVVAIRARSASPRGCA